MESHFSFSSYQFTNLDRLAIGVILDKILVDAVNLILIHPSYIFI